MLRHIDQRKTRKERKTSKERTRKAETTGGDSEEERDKEGRVEMKAGRRARREEYMYVCEMKKVWRIHCRPVTGHTQTQESISRDTQRFPLLLSVITSFISSSACCFSPSLPFFLPFDCELSSHLEHSSRRPRSCINKPAPPAPPLIWVPVMSASGTFSLTDAENLWGWLCAEFVLPAFVYQQQSEHQMLRSCFPVLHHLFLLQSVVSLGNLLFYLKFMSGKKMTYFRFLQCFCIPGCINTETSFKSCGKDYKNLAAERKSPGFRLH